MNNIILYVALFAILQVTLCAPRSPTYSWTEQERLERVAETGSSDNIIIPKDTSSKVKDVEATTKVPDKTKSDGGAIDSSNTDNDKKSDGSQKDQDGKRKDGEKAETNEQIDSSKLLVEEIIAKSSSNSSKCVGVQCTIPPKHHDCKESPVPSHLVGLVHECCHLHVCKHHDGSGFYHYGFEMNVNASDNKEPTPAPSQNLTKPVHSAIITIATGQAPNMPQNMPPQFPFPNLPMFQSQPGLFGPQPSPINFQSPQEFPFTPFNRPVFQPRIPFVFQPTTFNLPSLPPFQNTRLGPNQGTSFTSVTFADGNIPFDRIARNSVPSGPGPLNQGQAPFQGNLPFLAGANRDRRNVDVASMNPGFLPRQGGQGGFPS